MKKLCFLRKHFKKLFISFLSVFACFPLFCFSVSAETLIMTNPYSKPQLTGDNGFVELLYKNGDGSYSSCIWLWNCVDAQSSRTLVNVTINENGVVFSPSYASGSGAFSVVYIDASGYKEFSNILYLPGVNYTKTFGAVSVSAHVYGNYNDIIYNLPNPPITNFEIVYGGDIQLVNDVNKILEVLRSQNEGIIANYNANTDKIIDNQKDNTDKITNGWSTEDKPDTTLTDEYHDKEQELLQNTAEWRASAENLFGDFGSFMSDTVIRKGLLACSKVFMEFFKIDILEDLITFGLSIGLFAFVIGSSSIFIGRFFSNYSGRGGKNDK